MDLRSQASSLVGKTIADKYQLTRILGIGGMGTVFEALHTLTLRRVAVKVVHGWVLENAAAGKRFLREAQAAAQIDHPGIVDVLDAGQLPDGAFYLVFELLEGEDLEVMITRGRAGTVDIVRIIIDVLDVLSAAHASGFVHRDIKPANVFVARDRAGKTTIKLLDFGVAKRSDASRHTAVTAQGSIVGTLDYMSPEQAIGEPVDARSDLWAVAALMFRALSGRPPFVADGPYAMLEKIMAAPIPRLSGMRPDLPRDLTELVERGLERDRSRRWPTAAAMRDALLACDTGALETYDLPPTQEHIVRSDELRTPPDRAPPSSDERPPVQLGALEGNENTEVERVPLIAPDAPRAASVAIEDALATVTALDLSGEVEELLTTSPPAAANQRELITARMPARLPAPQVVRPPLRGEVTVRPRSEPTPEPIGESGSADEVSPADTPVHLVRPALPSVNPAPAPAQGPLVYFLFALLLALAVVVALYAFLPA